MMIRLLVAAACSFFVTAANAQQQSDLIAPEVATAPATRDALARSERFMISAANPLAVEAGVEILRRGGSAADALVTVQLVLGLVEPQSSGLGGGAFLLWYDAGTRRLTSFDARETAPAAAGRDLFLDAAGTPLPFYDAVVGGLAVGTPGVPALLETVHDRFGVLDWGSLFEPAITLAEQGFKVSPRLQASIEADIGRLDTQPAARANFFDDGGRPLAAGTRLRNPDYVRTLRLLAQEGAAAFYRGSIADRIVEAVRSHPTNPGRLTLEDLAAYEVVEREPVCVDYRAHRVCGMGPPSSGGLTVGQILGMVSHFDLTTLGPEDPVAWRILGDATRLAFADRGLYMADADFVRIPAGLNDPAYLAARAALIRRDDALRQSEVVPGEPPWDRSELRIPGRDLEREATSHLVIVDETGNIASLTTTIENTFGSRQMVGGFLLNNQLTDFAFEPESAGVAVANRVEPRKRPRSSMAPTIIFGPGGEPLHALGSPGGATIIPFVAKTIIALLDWDLNMQEAISLPHLVNPFGTYLIEAGTSAEDMMPDLQAIGYETAPRPIDSGLHGITITRDGLLGGADTRREGVAAGD